MLVTLPRSTSFSAVQPQNVSFPMLITLGGTVMASRLEQP